MDVNDLTLTLNSLGDQTNKVMRPKLEDVVAAIESRDAQRQGLTSCPLVGSTSAVLVTETTQRIPQTVLTLS